MRLHVVRPRRCRRARVRYHASLERCPNHSHGGCSLARHGTYARSALPGTRIARRQSSQSHTTFSLLPNRLAARFPGTFDTLEVVVVHAEAPTQSAAANALRTDSVGLPGAMRWVRRRVRRVHHVLVIVIGLPASTSPGASPMSRP